MTKKRWTRALALVLVSVMIFGLQQNGFGMRASAADHLLSIAVDAKYLAADSGTGETASAPIKIKRSIPDLLQINCSDGTLNTSSTYVYVYDVAEKDPAVGSNDPRGYSDYFTKINKTIPTYSGTKSKKLIADGWGADAAAYATTKKPMDKTYVVTLWKNTTNCVDKLYFRFCNENGTYEEDAPAGPRFTNTVTEIDSTVTLNYENVDLSVGTCNVMLYRWSEGWTHSSQKTNYLKDDGYNSYTVLSKSKGSVSYSIAMMNHYGAGKYVAVLGGPGWADYSEFIFTYTPGEDPNASKISMTSTLLAEGTMSFDIKCSNTTSQDWIAIYPKDFTNMYNYYDYVTAGASRVTFPSGQPIRYKIDTGWMPLPEGDYVAVLYEKGGYTEVMRLEFKVVANLTVKKLAVSSTAYVVGDNVNITASDFSADDGDFIRIVEDATDTVKYDSKSDGVKTLYSISTTGWATGKYTVIGYTGGTAETPIGQASFSLKGPDDKMVTLSKSVWFTNEDLIIKTKNWSAADKDFMRIYKLPITQGYNSGFLYQTYNDYGKSQYTVPLSSWEEGDYVLIAWDHGDYSLPQVAYIEFSIQVMSEVEGDENYTNDGSIITILNNCKMDLTNCGHKEIAGKMFNGWVDLDDAPVPNNSLLSKGTMLKASYVDVNAGDKYDFAIRETMIRTDGKLGLRFIVEKSNSLCEQIDITDYGTLALPAEVLNGTTADPVWKDLTYGTTYTYNEKEYPAADIVGWKTYQSMPDRMYYSCCLQGLNEKNFATQYVARGYLHYRDCNGVPRVWYTDYISANPYMIARDELATRDDLSDAAIKVLQNIVDTVETEHDEKYSTKTLMDVVGSSDDPNHWIYQIGVGGVMMREVEIDTGKGGDELTVMQLSDLHFNYMNATDFAERNSTLLSTYQNRTFRANGSSAPLVRNALDYAMTADQIVVTGDAIDYLSKGCVELLQKEIWDRVPNAMVTIGNHDYVQQMQGGIPESIPAAERWAALEKVWKHDIYYSSKVLGDKVMLIQMNNGEQKFYDRQLAPLQADLALAREKGYAVLIFTHETIVTNNPAMASVNAIRANDAGWAVGENFYTDPNHHHVGGNNADAATKAVCDEIYGNADIIKGVFNGHIHSDFYTEILGTSPTGGQYYIPQYTLTGTMYDSGHALKITVK